MVIYFYNLIICSLYSYTLEKQYPQNRHYQNSQDDREVDSFEEPACLAAVLDFRELRIAVDVGTVCKMELAQSLPEECEQDYRNDERRNGRILDRGRDVRIDSYGRYIKLADDALDEDPRKA